MYSVYVLISFRDHRLYIGQTNDLHRRFAEHCRGDVLSTMSRRPLKILFVESFLTRLEAVRREKWLKSGAGRMELKRIIEPSLNKYKYIHK
ncbi:MAG: GIY-YIG nuclease family protein [bacterium]|nr:GIY-YIG nuclease family protein [bacterium]